MDTEKKVLKRKRKGEKELKLALECPVALLDHVQPFADFDWVLTHLVLKDETYSKYYSESTNIKFVDNSVNELGEPCSLEELKEAFDRVNGTYMVSPDWIGDYKRTAETYRECVEKFGKDLMIPVLQGSTFEEAIKCLNYYIRLEAKNIAVPYDICSSKKDPPWLMGLRRALVVSRIPNSLYVHLLGFDNIDEFFWYYGVPNIGGIDTGIPIMLGLQGLDILDPLETKAKPTYQQMEDLSLTQENWAAICRNIALLRKHMP